MKIEVTESAGGILTGVEIYERVLHGDIQITPFDLSQLNPNSYNLRLSNKLKVYDHRVDDPIDSHKENKTIDIEIPETGFVLMPNKLYLGSTVERVATDKFIPAINGRSSGGRLGMSIHVCAGFGDIGFDGTWTLEIVVTEPLRIYPGDEVAQVCFTTPYGDTSYLYRGRYYQQVDPTASKFNREKDKTSLAYEAIQKSKLNKLIKKLYYTYGDYEFSSHGFKMNNLDASLSLKDKEYREDNLIYVNSKFDGFRECVGKIYEVDGTEVYIRRTDGGIVNE